MQLVHAALELVTGARIALAGVLVGAFAAIVTGRNLGDGEALAAAAGILVLVALLVGVDVRRRPRRPGDGA